MIKIAFLVSLIANFLIIGSVKAICPVCTIAIGAGIGLSRWLGVNDSITGLWIGGLIIALVLWTIDWLNRKNIRFRGRKIIVVLIYYGSIVIPLYWAGILGQPDNVLWGIDKLLLGIVLGGVSLLISAIWYYRLKEKNQGQAYFPLQKVVTPIIFLTILSIIFYFITK